jgi:predicted HTH domain antitoxin
MNPALTFRVPEDIWHAMRLPEHEKHGQLLLELAITLYQRGILSFGKARALAGRTKWEFDEEVGKRKIERHYGEDDVDSDLKYANE